MKQKKVRFFCKTTKKLKKQKIKKTYYFSVTSTWRMFQTANLPQKFQIQT